MIKFILNNEFPDMLTPCPETYKLIFEYKIPSLVYFTHQKDDPMI